VDHRATVLEDADPRLQKLPVAGARGPAYPGYVVGRWREDVLLDVSGPQRPVSNNAARITRSGPAN
jgi:hypothetical protein